VVLDGQPQTLLTAPMAGFYSLACGCENPGRTQVRVAYVLPPDQMAKVPRLFAALLADYEAERAAG
jgi:aspartate aminotransferase